MTAGLPLSGRRILVTGGRGSAGALADVLRARGADVALVPAIEIAPPAEDDDLRKGVADLALHYDWLLLTSANAVRAIAPHARGLHPGLRIASAGPSTSAAIASLLEGARVAVEARAPHGAEGLARAMAAFDVRGAQALFPTSDRSPATLARALRARGATVDVLVAYRTVVADGAAEAIREALRRGVDAVTFASPSAVEAFADLAPEAATLAAIAIGPTTADAARAAGFIVAGTAAAATPDALADAVASHLAER